MIGNDEFAAFARRIIKAHSRRVGAGDVEALGDLVGLRDLIWLEIKQAAQQLHAEGYSWAEIARPLGISKQAAHQAFGVNPAVMKELSK